MATSEEQFDEAMAEFSQEKFQSAIEKLEALLQDDPGHFDAQLALGMGYSRLGDQDRALQEGHKAEAMRPHDQLVHTNLSLFYVKKGDKEKAEHHGLQARIASWRTKGGEAPAAEKKETDPDLAMAQPKKENIKFSGKLPDMPWKKKKPSPEGKDSEEKK